MTHCMGKINNKGDMRGKQNKKDEKKIKITVDVKEERMSEIIGKEDFKLY